MPDMTLCLDNTCPLKTYCYRYIAIPDEMYQSYFSGPVWRHGCSIPYWYCEYYIDAATELGVETDLEGIKIKGWKE